MDKYDLQARLLPSLITVAPVTVIVYHLDQQYIGFLAWLGGFEIMSILTFQLAIAVIYMHLNGRIFGKTLQNSLFKHGRYFPTTDLLISGYTTFSENKRQKLIRAIKHDFQDVRIPGKAMMENNEDKARLLLYEATTMVKNAMRDNALVRQHNIEYGMLRNLCGGSLGGLILGILALTFLLFIEADNGWLVMTTGLILFYILILLVSPVLLKYYGKIYAETLYEQYLSQR